MLDNNKLNDVKLQFQSCTKVLAAIGDETRQHIMLALIEADCDGMRVGEITARTHLSRPAVSHHLKVLKDAEIVRMYKVATKNYYYLDMSSRMMSLQKLMTDIGRKAYAHSKTANILSAVELDRLASDRGVRAFAVHPGLIPTTGIGRFSRKESASGFADSLHRTAMSLMNQVNIIKWVNNIAKRERAEKFKSIGQGASTSVWCAASGDLDGKGGEDNNIAAAVPADSSLGYDVRPWAIDPEAARRLWQLSERLTGVKLDA